MLLLLLLLLRMLRLLRVLLLRRRQPGKICRGRRGLPRHNPALNMHTRNHQILSMLLLLLLLCRTWS